MILKPWIWFCLLVLSGGEVYGQTPRADSLLERIRRTTEPQTQLTTMLRWVEDCHSINRDTLDIWMPRLSSLAAKYGDSRSKSMAEIAYAHWYLRWGWADSAIFYLKPVLDQYRPEDAPNRDLWYRAMRLKAMCLYGKVRYAEALEHLFSIVTVAEKYGDNLALALASNSIGSVKLGMDKTEEALPWVRKSLQLSQGNPQLLAAGIPSRINMAVLLHAAAQNDSANKYVDQAMQDALQVQDLNLYAAALRVKSRLMMDAGKLEAAEAMLKEMMSTRYKMSGRSILVEDNMALANFYEETAQWQKAIDLCRAYLIRGSLEGNTEAQAGMVNNDPKNRYEYLEVLVRCLKETGNTTEYLVAMEELLQAKDSVYAASSTEAMARFEKEFELKEKEAVIAGQKLALWKQNLAIVLTVVLVVLASLIAIWKVRQQRRKQQAVLIAERIKQQEEADAAIRQAEEQERQRIAADLHDNLGAHAAAIASNMGMIPMDTENQLAGQALLEVRNNASLMVRQLNDTIWALKKESLPLTAIADRIKGFMTQIQASHQYVLMEVTEHLPADPVLPAVQAYHLYRVMQEGITNALKHGKANRVLVCFSNTDTQWMVEVVDNGIGLGDWLQKSNEGSGLMNMQQRCKACGWTIAWLANAEGGTTVRVMPTTN